MTFIDPVELTVEVLKSKGHQDVNSDKLEARALSSPEYILVSEATGSVPHIRYADRPSIQILVYSNLGFAESRKKSYQILNELQDAQGQVFENGGIHRVITVIRPSRQDVNGLPFGVGRTLTQVDYILSNLEKWSLA